MGVMVSRVGDIVIQCRDSGLGVFFKFYIRDLCSFCGTPAETPDQLHAEPQVSPTRHRI